MIADLEPNPERMRESARSGYSTATDLADWVTQKLNVPFRDAHHITGRAVKLAESKGCELGQLALADLQSIEPRINADVLKVLTVDAAAASRVSYGGTAPDNVRAQAKAARDRFLGEVLKW